MLRNYFIIALRNFKKYKIFSALNIFGLALGISCVVFIYSFISYELSFEKCYPKADRLYRITRNSVEPAKTRYWAPTAPRLGPAMKEFMPEIEANARFHQMRPMDFSINDSVKMIKKFTEFHGFFTDSTAFHMFDLKFVYGEPKTALAELHNIVISESMAERFFSGINPVGKTIRCDDFGKNFVVSGVMKDIEGNTHLKLNYLISMELLRKSLIDQGREDLYNALGWAGPYNYILLKENVNVKNVEAKMDDFSLSYWNGTGSPEEILASNEFLLQPIKKIHLHSKLEQEIGPNSDVTYVYVFSTVAILILLIAGVNYVNIATAQSLSRIKEIGIRKVVGAYRGQIIRQYFSESILTTIIAGALSILLIDILYPYFNHFSGLDYELAQFFSRENIVLMLIIIFGLGIIAGLYPALMASAFKIQDNIKGAKKVGSFSYQLRRVLIVLQFAIAVFLIFSTLSIHKQLRLFNNVDLGFQKENVVCIYNDVELAKVMRKDLKAFKAEIMQNPMITDVSSVSNLPGVRTSVETLFIEGFTHESGEMPSLRFIRADADYLKTMKIELLEGNDFISNKDTIIQFLTNESCLRAIGLKDPIGKYARNIWGVRGRIVGVVKDFNFASLHESIEPMVLEYTPGRGLGCNLFRYVGDEKEVLTYLETKLKAFAPNMIFGHKFITDQWDGLYETENKAGDTFNAFTILAIIISCIGLFGLSAFTAESRMKEMGIRKIHGAGILDITKAFGLSFFKLILVSTIFAIPVGWFIIERWLQDFEYRINMDWMYIVYSLSIILGIAFVTILYQLVKIHRENPIEFIKYE